MMRVTLTRRNVVLAGGTGVALGAIVIAAIIAFRPAEWLAPLAPYPIAHWVTFVFFGGVSLIEMPMMIFALRKLIADAMHLLGYYVDGVAGGNDNFDGVAPFSLGCRARCRRHPFGRFQYRLLPYVLFSDDCHNLFI
jgi:hypothetical protein